MSAEVQELGITETTEALVAANELTIVIAELLSDGAQVSDVAGLIAKISSNPELKAKLQAGIDNFKAIPAEVKDCNLVEGMGLAMVQLQYVPKLIAAFSKKA